MQRILRTAAAATLLLTSLPAPAWNAAGHRLTAAIAWRQLDTDTRTAVGRLLAAHPDRERWRNHRAEKDGGTNNDYSAFLEASTWADDIRRDRRFHDADEAPTPLLPGFPDMQRRRRWHHADETPSVSKRPAYPAGELARQLPRLLQTLGDRQRPPTEHAYALPWIIHLVADAHQPLHVLSRHDADGRSDRGGNELWVETPEHPRLRAMSLHAYWDDLPGPPWLRGERLERTADALIREWPVTTQEDGSTLDVAAWIGESRELARSVAYADLDGSTPVIDEGYGERARRTARKRITIAGYRLARVLELLLAAGNVSRETAE